MLQAYKNNILFKPAEKKKIIGDTSTKFLYGEVLSVGTDVKDISKGDEIEFTKWGTWKVAKEDGTENWYIPDDPYFILGVDKGKYL